MRRCVVESPFAGDVVGNIAYARAKPLAARRYIAYSIVNLANGKSYIGATCQPLRKRWAQHLSAARRGRQQPINAAIRKYGQQNFVIRHIASAVDYNALIQLEIALIAQYQTIGANGYNISPGGVLTSAEAAQKGAISLRGKPRPEHVRRRLSALALGRKHTEEARAKMSASRRGKPKSGEWKEAAAEAWTKRRKHLKGASPSKRTLWQAHIYKNGRSQYLGTYPSERAAHDAFLKANAGVVSCAE